MSEAITKRLQEFSAKVAAMTAVPELKQKKIERDAELKAAAEASAAAAAEVLQH